MNNSPGKQCLAERGFTMIELLVVLLLMAIMTVWGVSTYKKQSAAGRLQAVKSAMLEDGDYLTNLYSKSYHYTVSGDYKNTGCHWPQLPKTKVAGFDIGFGAKFPSSCTSERYILYAKPDYNYKKQEKRYLRMDENGNVTLCRVRDNETSEDGHCDLF